MTDDRPEAGEPASHDLAEDLTDGPVEGLVGELTRYLAETRADAAAASRARQRWLRQLAEEESRFAGVLVDLAEGGEPVVVHTVDRRRHRGTVRGVGDDFVAVRTAEGGDVLVAMAGINGVRAEHRHRPLANDRLHALDLTLAGALVALAGDRPRVMAVTHSGEVVTGELRAAGRDVATIRLDGPTRSLVYLPVTAIAEVTLLG